MTGQRVVILDGSQSLFDRSSPPQQTPTAAGDGLGLQPIPHFRRILLDAMREGISSGGTTPGNVAVTDAAIVCDAASVRIMARAIHVKVLAGL